MARCSNNLIVATAAAIFLTVSTCTLAACNNQDRKALLAFQASFGVEPFWPSTSDCCSWQYLRCNKGRVTSLVMSSSQVPLNGSLPAVLGDLTALEEILFIQMPTLVGSIPPQLSNLKRLKQLVLNGNLSGPVPSFLSQMPALELIDFGNNMFTGTVPPSLGNLKNLTYLMLSSNQLTGTIPSTLFSRAKKGNIYLNLSSNKLTGTIPRSFANVDFGNFYVDNNQLTGDASFLLDKNKKMTSLGLSYNKYAFDLTNMEFPATLTYVALNNNKIHGSISNQLTELSDLVFLDVRNNRLCGKIPSGGPFKNFTAFYFTNNKCLCGAPLPPCK